MSRKLTTRRRLGVEGLEQRWLMAGDVSAIVENGNLKLVGDDLDNAITITAGPSAGQIVVTGVADSHGVATKIKDDQGVEHDSLTLDDANHSIFVNLEGGDDSVTMKDVNITRNVIIRTGDGNDTVDLGPSVTRPSPGPPPAPSVKIGGNLIISLGDGNDTLTENLVEVGHNELIRSGDGNDQITLGAASPIVKPPAPLVDVKVGGNLVVQLGSGDDTFSATNVNVGHDLVIHGGDGADKVSLSSVDIGKNVVIDTGDGADNVAIDHVHAKNMNVHAGDGADIVMIADSHFQRLGVSLGGGDDTLSIAGTTVTIRTNLDGGDGTNTYTDGGGNSLAHLHKHNFT